MENARVQILATYSRSPGGQSIGRPYNQRALRLLIVGCGRVGSQIAANIDRADGFVAVTEGDNRNIMASQIAKDLYKVPHVVARIYDPERADAYEKLGLHTICPTIDGARHIEKVLLERESR